MNDDPATNAARRGYLFACGLALLAAVLGAAAPAPADDALPGGRATVLLVALAAVGIFIVAAVRLRGAPGDGPAGHRLRKMTMVWLGLAALLGAAVLRAPVGALWSGGPRALDAGQWLPAVAGAVVVAAALVRAAMMFKRRG